MTLLIKNGRIIDPACALDATADIFIRDGRIVRVGERLAQGAADTVIDASGKIIMPGLVDIHVHLREPGREDKETVESGTKAALKGGVTTVLAMPNTDPAIDSVENVRLLKDIIKKSAACDVLIASAITKGRRGEELVDFAALKKEGVVAVTDDGSSVANASRMFEALKSATHHGLFLMSHCEEASLAHGGVMNLGFVSTQLGLRGIPKASEFRMVERDVRLAEKAGARLHITHVSCLESAELIAFYRRQGVAVTADTAPHYFCLTDEDLFGFDANLKMNPPLRGRGDTGAIRECLKNGAIDAIASDHAPHTENEKEIEFDRAAFGVTGLETELSVAATELVATGLLGWPELVRLMSLNPARLLGTQKGTLKEGSDADIVVFDPTREWKVTKESFISKSKNSAFLGRTLKGAVECTIYRGNIVYTCAARKPHPLGCGAS